MKKHELDLMRKIILELGSISERIKSMVSLLNKILKINVKNNELN